MAMQGRRLDQSTIKQIKRLREVASLRKTAKEARVAVSTVQKYSQKQS